MRKRVLFVAITENSDIRGVERYSIETIKELQKKDNIELTILCGKWQTYYNDIVDSKKLKALNIQNSKLIRHIYIALIPIIYRGFDIIHYNNTLPVILSTKKVKQIITIHDIAEFVFPEKYSYWQAKYRRLLLYRIKNSTDLILTVSEFSKKQLSSRLSIDSDKIVKIYNGIDHFSSEIEMDFVSDYICKFKNELYIFFWGTIERTKGCINTVKAFIEVTRRLPECVLIIAGKPGNEIDEVNNQIRNYNNIIYLGQVNDDEIKFLSKNAKAVIFPSLYEGFGFPALEACIYNNNVITSNTTALGEITKGFTRQINPSSIEEIKAAILDTILSINGNTPQNKDLILSKYSWKNNVNKLLSIYLE